MEEHIAFGDEPFENWQPRSAPDAAAARSHERYLRMEMERTAAVAVSAQSASAEDAQAAVDAAWEAHCAYWLD